MKQVKKWIASPAVTIGALALAVILLGFSAIGGTRAALTYYSENYVSTMQLHELGVSLVENGEVVASGDAGTSASASASAKTGTEVSALLAKGRLILDATGKTEDASEPFKLGVKYQERLAVSNPTDKSDGAESNITQYVRVTIQRYWLTCDLTKSPEMNPNLIKLELLADTTGYNNGWIEDTSAHTDERTVLYYTQPLAPGATTPDFSDTLCIDSSVQVTVQTGADGTRTYVYNNASFQIEVKVDAVQDHNVVDAIRSAWGRAVSVDANGTLSLS